MASITSSGIGSGLNVEAIVSQLMQLEAAPLNRLVARQKEYQADVSAFGKIKSALSTFQTSMKALGSISKFEVYRTASSDDTVLTATASDKAAKGSFSIFVDNRAEAHKLRTDAGFAADAQFNTGALDISVGSGSFAVEVTSGNNTLEGIRDAINAHADNPGVTASIINDGTNRYLTLTADETGTAQALAITQTEDGAVTGQNSLSNFADPGDGSGGLSLLQAAEDASIRIDGLVVTSSSNQVEGVIEGVTIDLKAESGSAVTLTIERDAETVRKSVQEFADAYNKLRDLLVGMRKEGGDLEGDALVRTLEMRLGSILNTPAEGLTTSFSQLAEIGVTRDRDGKMGVDTAKLDKALAQDYAGVAELFANEGQGVAYRLEQFAKEMVTFDGVLDSKVNGIKDRIGSIDDQKDSIEYRLELIEKRYRAQFTALDTLMGKMQTTSSFLMSQLTSM